MKKRHLLLCSACIVVLGSPSRAQSTTNTPGGVPAYQSPDPFRHGATQGDDEDSTNVFFKRKQEEARKTDRKKRMVDTANRLLLLTKQLQADLKGREATPEDQKRLDEIARLAHMVKEQMRY